MHTAGSGPCPGQGSAGHGAGHGQPCTAHSGGSNGLAAGPVAMGLPLAVIDFDSQSQNSGLGGSGTDIADLLSHPGESGLIGAWDCRGPSQSIEDGAEELSLPDRFSINHIACVSPCERLKAERKRQRNRLAASRCRHRKLERISRLEER
ncbi:unnamed protein product [Lampetra planeri]